MTTRDDARRGAATTRPDGLRLGSGRGDADRDVARASTGLSLPEKLYAARERKGVDLYRAERDTKIRARYLAALEQGEYGELQGDVYTKGFLRNYATYLGLDPEEVIAQWRRERGGAPVAKTVLSVPKPIAQPRPGLQFSPGVVVAALLTIVIAAMGVWLGVQVMRFAKPPTLAVTSPREATLELTQDATSYTLAGSSIPGATISVELAGGTRQTSADSTGAWTMPVDVRRGRNEFKVDATDPDTGKHAEDPVMIVITVPFREIEAPTLSVDQPADGTTFENGAIPVSGAASNAKTSRSRDPRRTGRGRPGEPEVERRAGQGGRPAAHDPVGTTASGTPATTRSSDDWPLVDHHDRLERPGKSASLTRHVAVAYKGVNLVVAIKGGPAWIKVWVDGKIDSTVGRAGRTYPAGSVLTFSGKDSVEVRTGSSGATTFSLNGQSLGALGKRGIPETWLFQPPAAPALTQLQ
jgi:cytoskeletal protein RodZ